MTKELLNELARVVHASISELCKVNGDDTVKSWEECEEWQIDATITQVNSMYTDWINGIELTPSRTHEVWRKKKLEDGWVYGPIKDGNLKTHPLLVPFDKLSKLNQMKDILYVSICLSYFIFYDN